MGIFPYKLKRLFCLRIGSESLDVFRFVSSTKLAVGKINANDDSIGHC
jgi:hypothetical protein